MSELTRNVAIFIFDEVEVLDFCGPFEIFSVSGRHSDPRPFNVYTVAQELKPVSARNALSINPRYSFADCPRPDILVVPGGYGTRVEINKPEVLQLISSSAQTSELVLSVCTGSLLLAMIGLLDGLTATTHHLALAELEAVAAHTTIDSTKRFIDNGKIVTSAGVAAGIDMSLHVVGRLLGHDEAVETASYIEYNWNLK